MIRLSAATTRAAILAGVLAGLPAIVPPAAAQDARRPFDHVGLAQQAADQHIVPGYARLAEAAAKLSQTLDRRCAQPFDKPPEDVDAAFAAVVAAWGRIEHINFGPVATGNRLERILFFPDRRGLGGRQIARALETRDPAVTDAATLAGRSVALQGLGALDVVLYDRSQASPRAPEHKTHRCAYARAIGTNLAALTRALLEEWSKPDGYRHEWVSAGTGSRVFFKPAETTLALAKAFNQGLERVRDERLATALGLGKQRRKLPAVLNQSDQSLTLLKANIDGLLELYEQGGMHRAVAPPGAADDRDGVAAKAKLVTTELTTARDVVARSMSVPAPFDDTPTSRRLMSIGFPLKNARELVHEVLTLTANLTLGFNSSDGD